MRRINLTQGKFTKVDDGDFEWLSKWVWHYHKGYAVRKSPRILGKNLILWMHREILQVPPTMFTDHVDGDKLNNQRGNLRICTTSENTMNRDVLSSNTSGYKGVDWRRRDRNWRARIMVDGVSMYLGCFTTREKAASAYNVAAVKYHGKFARLNYLGGKLK